MIVVQVLHPQDALRRRLPGRDAPQKTEIPGPLNAGGDDNQQIHIGSRHGEGVYPAGRTTIRFPSRGRDPLSGVIRRQLERTAGHAAIGIQPARPPARRRIIIAGILVYSLASLLRGFATDLAWLLASHVRAMAGPVPGR